MQAIALALLSLTSAVGPAARTELGVRDGRFTLNGRPAFLVGISYYGALGADERTWQRDLDEARRYGINWVRVWATWAAYDNDLAAVDPEGRPREPYLRSLERLVAECDRRGMAADVTLSRSATPGQPPSLATAEALCRAAATLAKALRGHRNWYLDLANERDVRDGRYVSPAELSAARDAARSADPGCLVTASHGGDVDEGALREDLLAIRLDLVCPHRPRDPGSAAQTEAKSRTYAAWMRAIGRTVPLHYQEPFRRGYGTWEPTAADFLADLRGAIAGGAAGWCMHNGGERGRPGERPRRSFDLRDGRLFAQLDAEELAALKGIQALVAPWR